MTRRFDATWTDADRAEHESVIHEVMQFHGNRRRADEYLARINDAVQAHRLWARDIKAQMLETGALTRWKSVSRQGVVAVVNGNYTAQKPRTWAVTRKDDEGHTFTQDALIDVFTREDVMIRRRTALAMRRAYTDEVALWDRVIGFLDAAETDDIETAGAKLGMSLDEWLVPSERAS